MALGALGMVAGAAGEAGGGLLDLTGIGAAIGVSVNILAAGVIAGSGALAVKSGDAAGQDLSRMLTESQAESSGGGSAGSGGSAGAAPDYQVEGAEDIARGHAGEERAGDFPGMSLDDLQAHVEDVLRNPAESKPLSNNRAAYQGKDGTIVIYDPMHVDQGTVFKPLFDEADEVWESLN